MPAVKALSFGDSISDHVHLRAKVLDEPPYIRLAHSVTLGGVIDAVRHLEAFAAQAHNVLIDDKAASIANLEPCGTYLTQGLLISFGYVISCHLLRSPLESSDVLYARHIVAYFVNLGHTH